MSASLLKLEKICAKNPTSILFARLADEILQQGDVRRANEVCRQGLRYRPSYVTGHVVMGKCHLAAGRMEEARQEFHKVLQLDPDHVAALWYLGRIDLEMGWEELALRHFERAYALDPFNTELGARIESLQQAGRAEVAVAPPEEREKSWDEQVVPEEGIADEVAPEPEPEPTEEGTTPAEVAEETGTEALADLVEELSQEDAPEAEAADAVEERAEKPLEPIATSTLAELYVAQGLIQRAVEILERVAERDPKNEQVKARLAELQSSNANQAR